jgi:hypothetical protein
MRGVCGRLLVLALFAVTAASAGGPDSVSSCLPAGEFAPGWHAAGPARVFRDAELFTMIDGGADIYREYGFREALSAHYENGSGGSVSLEVYRMSDGPAAYGIFSTNAGEAGGHLAVGDEGRAYDYYLLFWKGVYFVSIVSSDTSRSGLPVMNALARAVDRAIPNHAPKPRLLRCLTKIGLGKERYFRGQLGLAPVYPFTGREVGTPDEGVSGKYPDHVIIVLAYPDTALAHSAFDTARAAAGTGPRFREPADEPGGFGVLDRNGGRLHFSRWGRYVIIVIGNGPSWAAAVRDVTERLKQTAR